MNSDRRSSQLDENVPSTPGGSSRRSIRPRSSRWNVHQSPAPVAPNSLRVPNGTVRSAGRREALNGIGAVSLSGSDTTLDRIPGTTGGAAGYSPLLSPRSGQHLSRSPDDQSPRVLSSSGTGGGNVFGPNQVGAANVFGSSPDLPGVVSDAPQKKMSKTTSVQIKPPAGVKLTPLPLGTPQFSAKAGLIPLLPIMLPTVTQPEDDLRRTMNKAPLPPIHSTRTRPATSGSPVGQSQKTDIRAGPLSASLSNMHIDTPCHDTSPLARSSNTKPSPFDSGAAKDPATNLNSQITSHDDDQTTNMKSKPSESLRIDVKEAVRRKSIATSFADSMPAAMMATAPADTVFREPILGGPAAHRAHFGSVGSESDDDAFASNPPPPTVPLTFFEASQEKALRPWMPAAGALRLLRPVRASDIRSAMLRAGAMRRIRQGGTGGEGEQTTIDGTKVKTSKGVSECPELDLYLPDKKLGVFVGTWNTSGDKVPDTVLDFLLPQDVEDLQDVIVLGTQESPSHRKSWEIKLQETLGPSHILLRTVALGTLYLVVFIRKELLWFVTDVQEDSFATRPGSMIKTKGAVALSMKVFGTSFLFLTSHLTAHQDNLQERNNDVARIAASIRLADSKDSSQADSTPLADRFDCVFWCGDMNYRCDLGYSEALRLVQGRKFSELLKHDQLTKLMDTSMVFEGFEEMRITFPPTFKFDVGTTDYDTSSKQRTPSWTDRVLYASRETTVVTGLMYGSCEDVCFSDHKPVYGVYKVSVVAPSGDALTLGSCPTIGLFNQAVYTEGNSRRLARLTVTGDKHGTQDSTVCTIL